MKVTVKILQGGECTISVSDSMKVSEVKRMAAEALNVPPHVQRLVYKGKTLSDDMNLGETGMTDGSKIHLMVRKGEASSSPSSGPSHLSLHTTSPPAPDFFAQLDNFLSKHLTQEQTSKVVSEFRKNCQLMVDSMNFDDIERFAASNCTEF